MRKPITLDSSVSVREAVELMRTKRMGCLLVTEQDQFVGIFTERDVLTRVLAKEIDTANTQLSEVMTRGPECLSPEDPVAFALNRMSVGHFRHIPLVNDRDEPAGVISVRAILHRIVRIEAAEAQRLKSQED